MRKLKRLLRVGQVDMKEYFATSDIHSYYSIFRKELKNQHFDLNNPEHILIVCGDCFDRGNETKKLYLFLKSLKDRFIYVRGNHEDLLIDCYNELLNSKRNISFHHLQNGTIKTISSITNISILDLLDGNYEDKILIRKMRKFIEFINNSIDYYEIGDNIFVHGWIPNIHKYKDLKKCTKEEWAKARWENGMLHWYEKHSLPNKTIFCGHWNCSFGNYFYHNEGRDQYDSDANCVPFVDDGIVALDAMTGYSKKINIHKIKN